MKKVVITLDKKKIVELMQIVYNMIITSNKIKQNYKQLQNLFLFEITFLQVSLTTS